MNTYSYDTSNKAVVKEKNFLKIFKNYPHVHHHQSRIYRLERKICENAQINLQRKRLLSYR
ncbi:MAG: hypothetical protein ACK4FL_02755 [Microgenomates group bacterium]